MTDTMPPSRTVWAGFRSYGFLTVAAGVAVILAVGFVSFILGVNTGDREVEGFKNAMLKLQTDNQRLTAGNQDLQAKLVDVQGKLAGIQATLDQIMPSANTFKISPNQSLMVADGHLTVGLIGTPGNESVDLNINGKQYSAAAGAVINISIDPSMNCRVEVMSFDVLKSQAVVNATCAATKP